MHTYLLTTPQKEAQLRASEQAQLLTAQLYPFEVTTIDAARSLKSFIKSGFNEKMLIWLPEFDHCTIPAQNALLKIFEEPTHNVSFLLTAESVEGVLETVRSRAQMVKTATVHIKNDLATEFVHGTQRERLQICSQIHSKDSAEEFLKRVLSELSQGNQSKKLDAAVQTYSAIKQNGNVVLHLTHLISKFESI